MTPLVCVLVTGFFGPEQFKVARLQSEFCTKDCFRATNFLTRNAPKFSAKFLSLYSVGQKKSPENSLQISHLIFQISLRKITKKIHRRASAGAQGEEQ